MEGGPTKHLPTEGAAELGQETSVQANQQDLVLLARWKPGDGASSLVVMETRMVERHEELARAETRRQVLLLEAGNLQEHCLWMPAEVQPQRRPAEGQRDDEAV